MMKSASMRRGAEQYSLVIAHGRLADKVSHGLLTNEPVTDLYDAILRTLPSLLSFQLYCCVTS